MKKGEFITISKRMVKEYFNRYENKTSDIQRITTRDVQVFGFNEDDDKYSILLTTPASDQNFYGVTYSKSTDELHSYIYKKVGKMIHGRKENV